MRWPFFILLFLFTTSAHAEIYKWVDSEGVVHYSSRAAQDAKSEDVTREVKSKGNFVSDLAPPPDATGNSADKKGKAKPGEDDKTVQVFVRPNCVTCDKAKAYLDKQGVSYQDMDISSNGDNKKLFAKLGGSAVPLIKIGKQQLVGFNEGNLDKALKAAGLIQAK